VRQEPHDTRCSALIERPSRLASFDGIEPAAECCGALAFYRGNRRQVDFQSRDTLRLAESLKVAKRWAAGARDFARPTKVLFLLYFWY
jgi:hypothetical protein